MSLVTDSPVHSSSSDGFATFLDAELESDSSDISPEQESEDVKREAEGDEREAEGDEREAEGDEQEAEDDSDSEHKRVKRQKVAEFESVEKCPEPTSDGSLKQNLDDLTVALTLCAEATISEDTCKHPGVFRDLCIRCGQMIEGGSGVALAYVHKDLRLESDEIARLRDTDLKSLLRHKKLYLVLDLDHTLLNSTRLLDLTPEELYLKNQTDSLQGGYKGNLFMLNTMHMLTKLRPYVHTFLKEASKMFEMYIYTMGERSYALEMAKLLDPERVYFSSRVISQADCTQRHQKGLDVVMGQESAVLILDDTESVWQKHKENLILMERYHFFASSCRQFGFNCKSPSELRSDESEADGALANILKVLQRIHSMYFDPEPEHDFSGKDVRQVVKSVRKEVLNGCKIVFTRVFPTKFPPEKSLLWKMAVDLGATCTREVDPLVTHVVSYDVGTEKSRWALREKKFLVHPSWLEATNYFWQKQPEENFPVNSKKDQ